MRNISSTLIVCAIVVAIPAQVLADSFFSDAERAEFSLMSQTNVCRERCSFSMPDSKSPNDEYIMERLEVLPFGSDRQVYLVERTGGCGSAGCASAVFVREGRKMVTIEERFGFERDRAERIARRALGLSGSGGGERTSSSSTVLMSAVAVVLLCLLSGVISRRVVHGLTLPQRVVVQSMTALVASIGLYGLGIIDEVSVLSIPLVAGMSVNVIVSLKDAFG